MFFSFYEVNTLSSKKYNLSMELVNENTSFEDIHFLKLNITKNLVFLFFASDCLLYDETRYVLGRAKVLVV